MFSLLCPKQFWTVHDETLYRSCRQTNLSEGGFVNKVPFFLIFFYFFFSHSLFSVSNAFALLSFSKRFHANQGGGCSDLTGEMGSQFSVYYLQNKILQFLIK